MIALYYNSNHSRKPHFTKQGLVKKFCAICVCVQSKIVCSLTVPYAIKFCANDQSCKYMCKCALINSFTHLRVELQNSNHCIKSLW